MAGEEVAAWTRVQPRRTLALVHTETGDVGVVDRFDGAYALACRGHAHIELIRVGHHFLNEELNVVSLAKWTCVSENGVKNSNNLVYFNLFDDFEKR